MKPPNTSKPDDLDEANGEPAGDGELPDARRSGIRARGARPPIGEGPCASFEEVHARYKHFVWLGIVARLRNDPSAAEDVFQQVLIRLDRRIRERGSVPHPVRPVLAGIMADEIKNHLRAVKRRRVAGEPEPDNMPSSKPNPEQLIDHVERRAELKEEVKAIFARMADDDVELIELAHVRGMLLQDVADLVGKAVGTVAVRLHRARARFRALYNLEHGSRRKP